MRGFHHIPTSVRCFNEIFGIRKGRSSPRDDRVTDIERAQYFFLSKIRLGSPMLYRDKSVFSFFTTAFSVFILGRGFTLPVSLVADFRMETSRHGRLWPSSYKKQPRIEGGHPPSRRFFHRKERRYKPLLKRVLSARCYRRFLLFFLSEIRLLNCTSRSSLFHLRDFIQRLNIVYIMKYFY